MNNYSEFAYLYDRLMADDFDYEEWYEYIEKIFKLNKKPKKLLEMACGTGSLSYFFAKGGYDLTAFDLSEEMLSIAYNKLIDFDNIKLLKLDMREFNLNENFDSIIATCDSINYIIESTDLLKTFTNVYEHLNDGGLFIFDINSHYKLKQVIGNNTFVEDQDDIFYVWENYFDNNRNLSEFHITFFTSKDGQSYSRFDEVHLQRAYEVKEIEELLKEVGFRDIISYEAFTFNPSNDKSERINFVANK